MSDTSGFYSVSNGKLVYSSGNLVGPGWELNRADKDTYSYPVNGWYWFDTETAAKEALGIAAIEAAKAAQIAAYTVAVQAHLDSAAQAKGYDSILSAVTYATSTVPRFREEGNAAMHWRDAVWDSCYRTLTSVENGGRAAPTVEELIAELPIANW